MPSTNSVRKARRLRTLESTSYSPVSGLSFASTTSTFDADQIIDSRSKSWVRTPGYRAIVDSHGVLPNNPFFFERFSIPSGGGVITPAMTVSGSSWSRVVRRYTGPMAVGVLVPTQTADNNKLNAKLLEAAKGNQWNVPIFIAEGRKTADMVVHTATQLVLMARALKRGRIDDFLRHSHPSNPVRTASRSLKTRFGKHYAKDPLGAFSSYWLQMTYGWVPFMSDVNNSVKTLLDTAERPDSLDGTVSARYSQTFPHATYKNTKVFSDAGHEVWGDYIDAAKVSCRATWHFTIKPADVPGRFGLTNPLEVVWELVPLSFVADWFLPIGDYLASLDASSRFSHRGGTYGLKVTTESSTIPKRCVPSSSTFTGFSGSGVFVKVSRTPMTSVPSLKLTKLSWEPNLGLSRVTSSFALLYQVFRK